MDKVHQETFGKSGCRRIVPGQYLAIDPKGRAILIGAVEKQKLAYILNRDGQARLTISSPLEAHKSNTFTYHMVGVDVGFDNPLFACLEIDYEEVDADPTGNFLLIPELVMYILTARRQTKTLLNTKIQFLVANNLSAKIKTKTKRTIGVCEILSKHFTDKLFTFVNFNSVFLFSKSSIKFFVQIFKIILLQ